MDITPIVLKNKNVIDGYGKDGFIINSICYQGSHILYPDKVLPFLDFDINNSTHFSQILNNNLEVTLIGTGENHLFPDKAIENYLLEQKINFEFMSTGAVCRTYNILLYECRQVCAVLIAL